MKKLIVHFLYSSLFLSSTAIPVTTIYATEQVSNDQVQAVDDLHLTFQEKERTKEIEAEVKRLNSLPEEQRQAEIENVLAQAEGQNFYFGEQIILARSLSMNARIVNGGINFFAYNKTGVNKLANTLGSCASGAGGAAGVAGVIAKFAPGISTKVAATIIASMGALVSKRFNDARGIIRSKNSIAGARITVTETIDITNKGINAYG